MNALHLKRVLLEYVDGYYNIARPHQGIGQGTPIPNGSQKTSGSIQRRKVLGVHNPEQTVHRFRSMPSTNSGACRPLIPEQIVHFFGASGMGGRHQTET